MNPKHQYIAEALRHFHQKLHSDPNNRYNLYLVTIKTEYDWLRNIEYRNRRECLENLTRSLIHKIERHLFSNPSRPCNAHKRIDARSVIESKSRFNNDTDHHAHSIFAVHQDFSASFNSNLIERVLSKGSHTGIPLNAIIHSIDLKHIDTSHNLIHSWDKDLTRTLDYLFKQSFDQKNPDWMPSWSYF